MKKESYNPAKRLVKLSETEGKRFKKLGDFGEILAGEILESNGFNKVRNLNVEKNNFQFADFYAEKEDKKYLISVKARNKYEHTGKLNSRYKLGNNLERKIKNALSIPEFSDCLPAWLTVAMEETRFDAYFGHISHLGGNHGIPMSAKACASYDCLAKNKSHNFRSEDFLNVYNKK